MKTDDTAKAETLWGRGTDGLPKYIDAEALDAWWRDGVGNAEEAACREACIALEVLAGMESPPEDKEARMAYQMKRLVEGMGGGSVDRNEQLAELINGFLELRPQPHWVDRFCQGVEALRK